MRNALINIGLGFAVGIAAVVIAVNDIATDFVTANGGAVQITKVIDGDTIKITTADGTRNARFKYIDTPELRGKCEFERRLAIKARQRLRQIIETAQRIRIEFYGVGYYGRPLITLNADGIDVGTTLIAERLARRYKRGRKTWCDGSA